MTSLESLIAHQRLANQVHETIDRINALLLTTERAGLRIDITSQETDSQYRAIDGTMLPSTRLKAFVYHPLAYSPVPELPVSEGENPKTETPLSFTVDSKNK